jgi:hypothetical protein
VKDDENDEEAGRDVSDEDSREPDEEGPCGHALVPSGSLERS